MLAVKWAVENGLLPENTKLYTTNRECGKMIEKYGKKLFWFWEHPMRTVCIARRPDLTLEDTSKITMLLIDMACPNEYKKVVIGDEKFGKYHQLCFEFREQREDYMLKVISMIIGCPGRGIKELRERVSDKFSNTIIMIKNYNRFLK